MLRGKATDTLLQMLEERTTQRDALRAQEPSSAMGEALAAVLARLPEVVAATLEDLTRSWEAGEVADGKRLLAALGTQIRLQPAGTGLEAHISGDLERVLRLAAPRGTAGTFNSRVFCWLGERPASPRALSEAERAEVLGVLHSDRFCDASPATVVATLLDEGTYLCSVRTMYRLLEENGEVRERRNQLQHPAHPPPELLATGPNELWSWDITKLLGPAKWTYYSLYVILDVFSRYVTGWMVAHRESAALAKRLIEETIAKQDIAPGELTIHADRGSSMTSKPVALLLADLGVTRTHSRPHVSNDNPYSEAQVKTLKYRPTFPARFGSIEDARAFCREFFCWYNTCHRHSGIAYMTPEAVHYGWVQEIQGVRAEALAAAYAAHPERFVKGAPRPWPLPTAAWINRPQIQPTTKEVWRPGA